MEDKIPEKNKSKSSELVNPIIPLERPEKEDREPSEYMDKTCHTAYQFLKEIRNNTESIFLRKR